MRWPQMVLRWFGSNSGPPPMLENDTYRVDRLDAHVSDEEMARLVEWLSGVTESRTSADRLVGEHVMECPKCTLWLLEVVRAEARRRIDGY